MAFFRYLSTNFISLAVFLANLNSFFNILLAFLLRLADPVFTLLNMKPSVSFKQLKSTQLVKKKITRSFEFIFPGAKIFFKVVRSPLYVVVSWHLIARVPRQPVLYRTLLALIGLSLGLKSYKSKHLARSNAWDQTIQWSGLPQHAWTEGEKTI